VRLVLGVPHRLFLHHRLNVRLVLGMSI
jgi:hypothetical protein